MKEGAMLVLFHISSQGAQCGSRAKSSAVWVSRSTFCIPPISGFVYILILFIYLFI